MFGFCLGSVGAIEVNLMILGGWFFEDHVFLFARFVMEQIRVNLAYVKCSLIRKSHDSFLSGVLSLMVSSFVSAILMKKEVTCKKVELLMAELGLEGLEEMWKEAFFVNFRVNKIIGSDGDQRLCFLL